jgi:hypothetical protein
VVLLKGYQEYTSSMGVVKQYLTQSISAAAGNLHLNSQQIETISLIRDVLQKSNSLEDDLIKMKKITEFSTMAIKLHEMHSYLTKGPIDILTLSEKFKTHSQQLVKDLNQLLSGDNNNLRIALNKLRDNQKESTLTEQEVEETTDNVNEKEITSEDRETSFAGFEEAILKPIKPMDSVLTEIAEGKISSEKIDEFADIMKKNSKLSRENGFDILSNMHSIVSDSLKLIKNGTLKAEEETIEALRSCLIVIAAVVRGKEVNISDYLTKAESFGNNINALKKKEEE